MYVYRDVTSGASQCITVTQTVTPDSTARCWRLTSDKSQTRKNGTSIVRCWDVGAAAAGCPACSSCMRTPSSVIHHRDPSGLCLENVSLSNTFDSTALNHLLTVFTSWSFLFYNSQFLLDKSGKELQLGARRSVCKFDLCFFYICKEKPIDL